MNQVAVSACSQSTLCTLQHHRNYEMTLALLERCQLKNLYIPDPCSLLKDTFVVQNVAYTQVVHVRFC